ncbi:helix-turn-helix domain-containing protein [Bacillus salipaludis]|uniref:Helix-turn-helix transcriptional regulator n=1 Tax=Bacillus salipaludis TaxID=2547811 RepID=A0AA90QPM9_9BACI|nr:helix-turn-helix transcriptional regulator [Bacillus salipaludis]MDQ6595877.1 helix-turn-helix transcriptional regulator [Bacillus salipaludis]
MIGERIRYFRKMKNITQKQLAEGICAISYLSKIESGTAAAGEEVIRLLCERLELSDETLDEGYDGDLLKKMDPFKLAVKNKQFSEAEKMNESLKEAIQKSQSQQVHMKYDIYLFGLYVFSGKTEQSQFLLEKIQKYPELLQDRPHLRFDYYYFLSIYYYLQEQFQQAIVCNENMILLFNLPEVTEGEKGRIYYNQALACTSIYQYFQSILFTQKALEFFRREFDNESSLKSLILLGINHRRVHNYRESERFLKRSLQLSQKLKDDHSTSIIYHNLGYLYSSMNQTEEALQNFQAALDSNGILDHELLSTYYLIAKEYMNLGNKQEARRWCDQALSKLKTVPIDEYYYHIRVLDLEIEQVENSQYEELLLKAISYFEREQLYQYVTECSEKLANFYFKNTKYKKASEYYRLANNARKNIN